MHPVPGRPQRAPHPDQGVVLDGLGQHQVAPRAQHPADLGQHLLGVLQVVQHVDAPHQAHAGVGQGQGGPVGHRHRGLGQGVGGAGLVVLDADGIEAPGAHAPQPVAPATAQVEHGPGAAQAPEMSLEPGVQGLVVVGGRVPARARGQGPSSRRHRVAGSGRRTGRTP